MSLSICVSGSEGVVECGVPERVWVFTSVWCESVSVPLAGRKKYCGADI